MRKPGSTQRYCVDIRDLKEIILLETIVILDLVFISKLNVENFFDEKNHFHMIFIFSLPEQRSRRAIVLPSASALTFAYTKVLR